MEFTVQGVNEVDSDHIRFAIFDSHRRYAASVEQVNVDFMMNFMDILPFILSSIIRPPSPPGPHLSPPASPHPPTPPTHPVSHASPSVSEGHMSTPTSLPPDTDRQGTTSEYTDVVEQPC